MIISKYILHLVLIITILRIKNTITYKLNVPKVLLPFHSSKVISFVLEAKSENNDGNDDACFAWSSSRPDIVSITPIYDNQNAKIPLSNGREKSNECSSRAIVSAVSKHPQRWTSIILAKEIKTDKLIRCDVIIDQIDSIRIKHTTTHLYLEDSPECFTVEALDAEGNTFTTLDGLPFEWSIINDINNNNVTSIDSRNVLRISKFIESEYVVSDSIKQLEQIGLSGNKILIEGLKTGTANVQSKLLDSYYKDMKTPLVRLLVVANIILEPSHPVYLLIGAIVQYNVFLIKQTSIDKINLPSLQYYFDSRNKTVTNLVPSDHSQSTYIGLQIGSTDIVLIDRNMKEELLFNSDDKIIVPPPTVSLHVVNPDYLVFIIKNWRSSWVLEVGRIYEIIVLAYTQKRQQIYPSDNLKIESKFDLNKFRLIEQSKNGSYHRLEVLEKGQTQAQAFLKGTVKFTDDSKLIEFDHIARGEQDIELLDPIRIKPNILIFAYTPPINQVNRSGPFVTNAYEFQLIASGGSGSYHWQSRNTTIISVNNQGLVRTTATKIGKTNIVVTDTRNIDIESNSIVYVLEPIDLELLACPVETHSGSKLYLNIKMNARLDSEISDPKILPINDCSKLQFEILIKDETIFKFVSIQSPSSVSDAAENSCAILVLDALKVGTTQIKINTFSSEQQQSTFPQLTSNEITIGSYSKLKSFKHQLVLAKCSSSLINIFDGPLSSIKKIDFENLYIKEYSINNKNIQIESIDHNENHFSYRVKCLEYQESSEIVKFTISHRKTNSNKCPLKFDYEIKVVCSKPHQIQLSQLFVNNEEDNDNILNNNLKWKCPIKLSSNLITAHFERPLYVQMIVKDKQNQIFDNFTSLKITWNSENKHLLDKSTKYSQIKSIELALNDLNSLIIPGNGDESLLTMNVNRFYYQIFDTKSNHGDTKLNVKLFYDQNNQNNYLTSTLTVKLVSDVQIKPDVLTIFNHPSNVVPLQLSHGSGHFNAEIETLKLLNEIDPTQQRSILKINQLNENQVVVSPLTNSGLTNLNIFDYCVPPSDFLPTNENKEKRLVIKWPPTATSKIQIAGINSIMVSYEDDKVEINKSLKIFVQISDATGTLIKKSYFPLMELNFKLVNVNEQSTSSLQFVNSLNENIASLQEDNVSDEYTAVYVLNALRNGVVMVQFEALENKKAKNTNKMIRSPLKEIQIYNPLRVDPKFIQLIRGAYYQVTTTGGPISPDASLKYEIVPIDSSSSSKSDVKSIINVNSLDGVVEANKIGKVKVLVKSVGTACVITKATTINPQNTQATLECIDNKEEKIYSEDYFIVKVVELKSIHIQTPLKYLKRGNEMPIYLMANDLQLNPLQFGSCPDLKFIWKINDQQIGILYHPFLSSKSKNNNNEDLFENSVSLRFQARQSGHVKISVKVEFKNNYFKYNEISTISDTIDLYVFDEVFFEHFPLSYFSFKYPDTFKQKQKQDEYIKKPLNDILMSPGSQFQIKTNLDKQAVKKHYELKFFLDSQTNDVNNQNLNKYCNNNTISITNDGLISVAWIGQNDLKNFHECNVGLIVNLILPNEQQKQKDNENQIQHKVSNQQIAQILSFTIRVKPISYSMLKLTSITKSSDLNRIRLDKKSLIKNRLILNDVGIQMKWHVKYYDNLGDMFDIVSLTNEYRINRNDLVDISKLNVNLFKQRTSNEKDDTGLVQNTENKIKYTSNTYLSFISNSLENTFEMKTLRQGRFLFELTPYSSTISKKYSRDYLSLVIDNIDYNQKNDGDGSLSIGDIICLNGNNLNEEDDEEIEDKKLVEWSTESSSNILKLISSRDTKLNDLYYTYFGICMNEGNVLLKRQATNQIEDLISRLININIAKIEKVKFLTTSFVTNSQIDEKNFVNFQIGSNQNYFSNQNCSNQFELLFKSFKQSNELSPFKCYASLYSSTGKRLAYLDRLLTTEIAYRNNHWSCVINFTSDSEQKLYDLIDQNIERPTDLNQQTFKNQVEDIEPKFIRVHVDSKYLSNYDDDFHNNFDRFNLPNKYVELKFIPAFYVQTKLIEMSIIRDQRKMNNDQDLSDHFNLIIHTTCQIKSHLILTTNCPSLIQIKPILTKQKIFGSDSILTITYDILTNDETFDVSTFANLLQQQNGQFYVQVVCSLTQQIERIPIKFNFAGDGSFFSRQRHSQKQGFLSRLYGWLFNNNENQLISFLALVLLTSLTILFLFKYKTHSQDINEQIALNASTAAVALATKSYRQTPSPQRDTFNPYNYFEHNLNATMSPKNIRTETRLDSTRNISPSKYSPSRVIDQQTVSSPSRLLVSSPRRGGGLNVSINQQLSPSEADRVQLFSVQSTVQKQYTDPTNNSFSIGLNTMNLYSNENNSDNESQQGVTRRVPPGRRF